MLWVTVKMKKGLKKGEKKTKLENQLWKLSNEMNMTYSLKVLCCSSYSVCDHKDEVYMLHFLYFRVRVSMLTCSQ